MTKTEIERDISKRFGERVGMITRNEVAEYLNRSPKSNCIGELLRPLPKFNGRGYAVVDVAEAIFHKMK